MRALQRAPHQLRPISIERGISHHAEGSCFIKFGNTHVYCTASLEEKPPPWLRGQNKGWISAEYAMLPRATSTRSKRESVLGKVSGRSQEIQRLIGRSLRCVTDLSLLGERQITLDCDVVQADGGTRTAAITGSWIALHDCLRWMQSRSMIRHHPLQDHVAAVACGVKGGMVLLDLDYEEDSAAQTDANFVMTGKGQLIEVQATAEKTPFTETDLTQLLTLARAGVAELIELQKAAIQPKG